MRVKNLSAYAGLCAGAASIWRPGRGRVVCQSDWMDYAGITGRGYSVRVFDCFGDTDSDGFPDDSGGCGLGSSRWYYGSGFSNLFVTNDMPSLRTQCSTLGWGVPISPGIGAARIQAHQNIASSAS